MTNGTASPWDEATQSGNFVRIESGDQKTLKLTNWDLEKVNKFGEEQWEFQADCLEEDGVKLEKPKRFTTLSTPLKRQLRALFEGKQKDAAVSVRITRAGERMNTSWTVKEVRE